MDSVLVFHNRNDYTGSTRVLATVIQEKYCTQRVRVITIKGQGFLSELTGIKISGVWYPTINNKEIPFFTFALSRLIFMVYALLLSPFYNHIYINTITQVLPALVSRIFRKHVIFHIHEKYTIYDWETRLYEWLFDHLKGDRIYVSKYIHSQYKEKKDCPSKVVYNKLPKEFIEKVKVTPVEERQLDTISMLSSLTIQKGVPMFVELARKMQNYKFKLVVSTSKEESDHFFSEGIPNNLVVINNPEDVHSIYEKTDVVVNLTDPRLCIESFGMTLLEAFAYGIPVVAPNVGGPREIVNDGINGFCLDVTDVNLIANHLSLVLANRILYIKLSNNALQSPFLK